MIQNTLWPFKQLNKLLNRKWKKYDIFTILAMKHSVCLGLFYIALCYVCIVQDVQTKLQHDWFLLSSKCHHCAQGIDGSFSLSV